MNDRGEGLADFEGIWFRMPIEERAIEIQDRITGAVLKILAPDAYETGRQEKDPKEFRRGLNKIYGLVAQSGIVPPVDELRERTMDIATHSIVEVPSMVAVYTTDILVDATRRQLENFKRNVISSARRLPKGKKRQKPYYNDKL